jgi:hypothetical protein
VTSSKAITRYQDIRLNVAKIKDYVSRGEGMDAVLTEQGMAMPSGCAQLQRLKVSYDFFALPPRI